jgi:hypothetical protein
MTTVQNNNTTSSTPLALTAALLLIAVVGGLGYAIFRVVTALNSGVAAAVVTASITALVSILSLAFSRRAEQTRAIQEAQREHKRGIYEEFMAFWFGVINAPQLGEEPPGPMEITRFKATFNQKLILWASEDML